jgi:hypothetical protein
MTDPTDRPDTCIVCVSGGATSAVALERVIQQFPGRIIPVFCDTKQEDQDLYRFLADLEQHFKRFIVRLQDGRDIWQVFQDERFIGNTRVDICSRILKREQIQTYLKVGGHKPERTILAFGMNTDELTRIQKLQARWEPYKVWCPLTEPPFMDRCEIMNHIIDDWDIDPPKLYEEGFKHNNCGGACVKGGHGAWLHLYRKRPATYLDWEQKERQFRLDIGQDVAILRDRRGGETIPMTLETLRYRFDHEGYRPTDWGEVCNCMGN